MATKSSTTVISPVSLFAVKNFFPVYQLCEGANIGGFIK
jgi:hypothetical protein